jgi:DNA (cytosine-5)-methyltransferase 1
MATSQALCLEQAGFAHQGVVELDADACRTLRRNKTGRWPVIQADLGEVGGSAFPRVDLLAGGLPCLPFSVAGRQLGRQDERDLFPQALRLTEQVSHRTVLLENVPGLAARRFGDYRVQVLQRLHGLGYRTGGRSCRLTSTACRKLRPRFVLVVIRPTAVGRSVRLPRFRRQDRR